MSAVEERPFARLLPALILFAFVVALGQQALAQFSLVQDSAKAELGLTDIQLGLIQGLGAAVPMLLLSIPIGILVDRSNRMRLTIILAAIWAIGCIGTAFATDLTTLILSRMAAGVGATGAVTAVISIAADLCAPAQRGRAMLILTVGKSAGIAAAIGIGGWVLALLGSAGLWGLPSWRALLLLLGLVSLATVLLLFTQREPARREVLAGPGAPFREVFGELWARRRFLIPLFIGQISVTMADASAGTFVAPILARSYGIPPEAASWVGGVLFLTGIAGSIAGGVLADLGHRSGKQGGILYGAIAAAAIGVPAALFSVAPSVPLFGVGLGVLMFCGTITGLITAVVITVLLPNELRGLCIGAFLSLAGLIGFGAAPPLVTLISTMLGGEKHLGEALALVAILVSIVSVFAFIIAARRAPHSARSNLSDRACQSCQIGPSCLQSPQRAIRRGMMSADLIEASLMDRIPVSPEMVIHLGAGALGETAWPPQASAFVFDYTNASFLYLTRPSAAQLDRDAAQERMILVVARTALSRLLGRKFDMADGDRFHLPAGLRAIAQAVRDCSYPESARTIYRGAKAIEAVCEIMRLHLDDELVPFAAAGSLSIADSQRLMVARRYIEDRWAEKLTLDLIARACGLNRAKLTRGFRDLFSCSVADAIVEQRLGEAKQMLLVTDLPVSSIGYRCGYLNNASFARAFSRHFGLAPTQYRAAQLAA